MNILIVDKPDQLLLDLQVVLLKTHGCTFTLASSALLAIKEYKITKDLVLIIVREEIDNEQTLSIIKKELLNNQLTIPIISRKSTHLLTSENYLNEDSLQAAVESVSRVISDRIAVLNKEKIRYIPVKITQFLSIESTELVCDIYIKIKKSGSPDQFIKRLHAQDRFTRLEVERYMNSGLEEFYIRENQYPEFISIEIIKSLSNPNYKELDTFNLSCCAYETALERLKLFAVVDELTIKLVDESIKSTIKLVEKNNALSSFMKHLKANNASFAFLHCYFIAMLAEKLVKYFEWNTPQARNKLIYLAFFHDISLTNLEWTRINNAQDLEKFNLSAKDKDLVLNHALKSTEIMTSFKEIPFGLAQLIHEHHGQKSGIGFSENMSSNISPISMMFIVLEDFVCTFIENNIEQPADLEIIFIELEKKYNKLTYSQTLLHLRSIFLSGTK